MNSKLRDSNIDFQLQHAIQLQQSGMINSANSIYRELLKLHPKNTTVLINLAISEFQRGNLEEGVKLIDASLKVDAKQPFAHHNRGLALHQLGRFNEALASYDHAVRIKPDYAEAYNNRGLVLQELNKSEEAVASYDHAIRLVPSFAQAHSNRGLALQALKKYEDALLSYELAIQFNPDVAEIHFNQGNLLKEMKEVKRALTSFGRAIKLKPDYAEAHNNRGTILLNSKQLEPALNSFDEVIKFQPLFAQAHINRGLALQEMNRFEEAVASFDCGLAIQPDIDLHLAVLLSTKLEICDWKHFDALLSKFQHQARTETRFSIPFDTLMLSDDPEIQKKTSEVRAPKRQGNHSSAGSNFIHIGHDRIKLGYFSSDFYNHATMHLMEDLFKVHDKSKFELIAFSFGSQVKDNWRQRIVPLFDRFIDVSSHTDIETADMARQLEIDIAIDLKGYTRDSRPGVFAERAAPVQVNYLGFPGTMGSSDIDYIIADRTVIPESSKRYFSEKIIYLPSSYQANINYGAIAEKPGSRAQFGLPETGFVYACFNKNAKITPETFSGWMRILMATEGSVLWLFKSNDVAERNLRSEAESKGVDGDRLVFAPWIPRDEHLQRIQLADLFLDTFPYNAHTTASDALRAGVPVLTRTGRSFASRVAASLLNATGLPELITQSEAEYEARAVAIATDAELLGRIKRTLQDNLPTCPLFDTRLFARHIESAYSEIYRRHQFGLPPDHVHVQAR